MRTFPETSSRPWVFLDPLARFANSNAALLALALLVAGIAAALALSEVTPDSTQDLVLMVCPACVEDLWFTPLELPGHP